MKCSKCGNEVDQKQKFCPGCGEPVAIPKPVKKTLFWSPGDGGGFPGVPASAPVAPPPAAIPASAPMAPPPAAVPASAPMAPPPAAVPASAGVAP
ncbi:MAG: zinc ribbon domain-containing protein, partial [Deltaproteobacteria bacterium]|nr:zinc ribbon domain-containing protein [Deltaproteobacteria bacterium]